MNIQHHNLILTYENMDTCPFLKKLSPGENRNGFQGVSSAPNFTLTVMVEDTETNQIWYFQIETSSRWHS